MNAASETGKTAEWFLTQGSLGIFCLILMGAVVWLMLRREKDRAERDAEIRAIHVGCALELKNLNEAHKQEMRENGKALMAVTQQLVSLGERRRP